MKRSTLAKLDRSLFWLSGTALAALAAALSSVFLLVSAVPLWAVAGWRRRRGGEPVSAGASAGLAALVFAMLLIAVTSDPTNFIEYFSMCLGGLVLVKQFDLRTVGDRSMLLCICAALVIGAALLHSSLVIGVVLLSFLVLAFRCAALLQIAIAEDRAGVGGRSLRWASASRAVWVCGAVSSVVMAAVFVVMPRGFMASPVAFAGSAGSGDVTGFDPEIELRASGQIRESYEPVLEVRSVDGDPDFERLEHVYLRGSVLDTYSDGGQRISAERGWLPFRLSERSATLGETSDTASRYEITLVGKQPKRLFTVGKTGAITLEDAELARLRADAHTREIRIESGRVLRYTIEFDPLSRPGPDVGPMAPAFYGDRIAAHARELASAIDVTRDPGVRHTSDDERLVRYLERHLRTNYGYTLDRPASAPGEDPVEAFLFTHRVGHCEYFATALTALVRSLGIEARVITGFLTTERTADGAFVARNAHAHAWVEAHVAPGVWMRFDASPPGEVAEAHKPPGGVLLATRRSWAWLSDLWVRSVVSYDGGSQQALLGSRYERFLDAAASRSGAGRRSGLARSVLRAVGAATAAFVLTMAVGMMAPLMVGALGGRRVGSPRRGGLYAVMRRADRAVARAGFEREEWTPFQAHARAVRSEREGSGRLYGELAALHYRVRFGGEDVPAGHAAELLARLRETLREENA